MATDHTNARWRNGTTPRLVSVRRNGDHFTVMATSRHEAAEAAEEQRRRFLSAMTRADDRAGVWAAGVVLGLILLALGALL